MELTDRTVVGKYDRAGAIKAFDEMKIGVKGLVDSGITKLPLIFHNVPVVISTNQKLSSFKIPTIDLGGGVLESKVMREIVTDRVREAVGKFGFFEVVNHGIPEDVMEKLKDRIRGFHDQESELRKLFYSRDVTKKVIYNTNFDLHCSQAANWRDTLTVVTAPDVPNKEDLPAICGEIMLEYSKRMMKLGELIFELLSQALSLKPNHLKELNCAKSLSLHSHYYPPCPEPNQTFGLSSHTDISFITVLLQDHIGGLQVLHDGCWIDVPPTPGALLVNIGDILQLMTNDEFVSVEHRVLANRGKEPRVSIASFFVHPLPDDQVYGPIKELLSEQNPPKYKDTTTTEISSHYLTRGLDGISSLLPFRIRKITVDPISSISLGGIII